MKLRMFTNGELELKDVISGEKLIVINRTNQLDEIDLDAEMEGLIDKVDF